MNTSPDPSRNENTYVLDAESATEMARLMHQDTLVTQNMGGLFPERDDLSSIHAILDIGCGPGGWVLDVAREYPEIEVTGIDISQTMVDYARAHGRARGFSNARFKIMNALKPLEFPDNSFDLVNARTITAFMYPAAWPVLLKEVMRICRPGGIIRLTEGELPLTNSVAYETLNGMLSRAMYLAQRTFSPDGRNLGITPMLGRLLRDAGYQNVQKKVYVSEYLPGTDVYEGLYQDAQIGFPLVAPFLIQLGITAQEEFDRLHQQLMAEMLSDNFCAVGFLMTVWGNKPQ
jgi:ubiquinone/menaquinone biosynthesis C-methylase UbiE